jgi:hypothetical protein
MFKPYARLLVFRSPGETDMAHLSSLLGTAADTGPSRPWSISTCGLQAGSARAHVDELLEFVSGKSAILERLRSEGYWVAVFFHDTQKPDPCEVAEITAALEALDISFDFELER